MHQRLGQAEPLLHPLGKPVDVVVFLVRQVQQLEHLADDLLARGAGDLVGDGEEVKKFPDLHAIIDAEIVGHEADHPANRHGVGGDGVAADPPLARGRPQQGRQEPDRRALARAVGPDEAEDLPLADGEAEIVDGHEVSVALGEVDHFNHVPIVSRLTSGTESSVRPRDYLHRGTVASREANARRASSPHPRPTRLYRHPPPPGATARPWPITPPYIPWKASSGKRSVVRPGSSPGD